MKSNTKMRKDHTKLAVEALNTGLRLDDAASWNAKLREEVKSLQAERDRLREALKTIANLRAQGFPEGTASEARRIARRALEGEK